MNKVINFRKRHDKHLKDAEINLETAELMYTAGSADFVADLVRASKSYGAAEAYKEMEEEEMKNAHIDARKNAILILDGIIQKMYGMFFIILSLLSIKILDGDGTVALMLVPFGIYLVATKRNYVKAAKYILAR